MTTGEFSSISAVEKYTAYEQVLTILGFRLPRGRRDSTPMAAIRRVRRGFPVSMIDKAMRHFDLPLETIEKVIGVTRAQVARLRARGLPLSPSPSDRLYRLVRLGLRARELLETQEEANRWIRRPAQALGGVAPVELLDTDAGTKMVECLIGRLEHGIVT